MFSRHAAITVTLSLVVAALSVVPSAWAQLHHEQAHRAPAGAAHDQRFDDIDKAVRMFESKERDSWQKPDEVMMHLALSAGNVVVDIGAGTGYFTRRFAAAVGPQGKAVGLDVESTMTAHINAEAARLGLANLSARQVPADDPGLAPQSVDVVFICDTYHHMQARVDYARRLATALKPGGRVVIVDFHARELPLGPPMKWKLTPDAVTAEFRQAGFELSRSVEFLPYQYFLEFKLVAQGDARVDQAPVLSVRASTRVFAGASRARVVHDAALPGSW